MWAVMWMDRNEVIHFADTEAESSAHQLYVALSEFLGHDRVHYWELTED